MDGIRISFIGHIIAMVSYAGQFNMSGQKVFGGLYWWYTS